MGLICLACGAENAATRTPALPQTEPVIDVPVHYQCRECSSEAEPAASDFAGLLELTGARDQTALAGQVDGAASPFEVNIFGVDDADPAGPRFHIGLVDWDTGTNLESSLGFPMTATQFWAFVDDLLDDLSAIEHGGEQVRTLAATAATAAEEAAAALEVVRSPADAATAAGAVRRAREAAQVAGQAAQRAHELWSSFDVGCWEAEEAAGSAEDAAASAAEARTMAMQRPGAGRRAPERPEQ